MYYHTYTLATKPGKRYAAIDHLKKLAQHMQDTYGVPSEVTGNLGGRVYQNHLVMRLESLAQLEQINQQLRSDKGFQEWFVASVELLEWQAARTYTYEVF